MRSKILSLTALLSGALFLGSCSLLDSASDAFNVVNVKFSEGSPAVDGQNVIYSGSVLETPSLDKFVFKMVFHVKADNSKNSNKASFGSALVKPILDFHINAKSPHPISTTIEPFSVEGGKVGELDFPIEIPITAIDRATARKIVNGEPIPYFLTGSVKFDLLEGTSIKGSGKSELDLTSGAISTRPSGSVTTMLSKLL
jgi:hypothetical protein